LEQYEEAVRYGLESIELAAPYRKDNPFFIFYEYMYIAAAKREMKRPQEAIHYIDSMQMELERLRADNPELNMQRNYFYMECDRSLAFAESNQPVEALAAIRRAEAVYDPQWADKNPGFSAQIDLMYASYYRTTGNYDKALELFERILSFDEKIGTNNQGLLTKQEIADTYFDKGDLNKAAVMYRDLIKAKEELNKERFYEQLNELRTLYEVDKAELEAAKHLAELRRQRLVNTGLTLGCLTLILIAALTVWNRKKITEKNRGLFRQIKEQDALVESLKLMAQRYETLTQTSVIEAGAAADDPVKELRGNRQQRQIVARLEEYLLHERRFADTDINLDDLIAALATNRKIFYGAIKAVTDKSPIDYIRTMQLEEAKKMLEINFELNIEMIAEQCGFNSRVTFYRLFRERYQINPAEYRKIAKEKS
jgi:AraC-like DNA-binding protein